MDPHVRALAPARFSRLGKSERLSSGDGARLECASEIGVRSGPEADAEPARVGGVRRAEVEGKTLQLTRRWLERITVEAVCRWEVVCKGRRGQERINGIGHEPVDEGKCRRHVHGPRSTVHHDGGDVHGGSK